MSSGTKIAALLGAALYLFAAASAVAAENITFSTDFGFNGRHAYYYVALEKGYYAAEGLNVTFVRGQGSADSVKKVAAGNAQLGFADAGALVLARGNDDVPVKLVCIIYAEPPHAIFAIDDGTIKKPADLKGKRLADTAFSEIPVIFKVYAERMGLNPGDVQWVMAESSALPSLLATGRVDGVGQFTVGEPLLAAAVAPRKLVRFAYKDAGLSYYGNGIIASEEIIKTKPEMVRKFVAATFKGMQAAFANPAEAGVILNKHHKGIDPAVGAGETQLVGEMAVIKGRPIGSMDPKRIEATIRIMELAHKMKRPVTASEMYVDGFLP
jgi:NitT/TauT family transport system substrate-binding protein